MTETLSRGTAEKSIYHLPGELAEPDPPSVYHLPEDLADKLEIPPGMNIHTGTPLSSQISIRRSHPSIAGSPRLDSTSAFCNIGNGSNVAYTLTPPGFSRPPLPIARPALGPAALTFHSTHQGSALESTFGPLSQTGGELDCLASTVGPFSLALPSAPRHVANAITPSPAANFARPTVRQTMEIPKDNCGDYHGQSPLVIREG